MQPVGENRGSTSTTTKSSSPTRPTSAASAPTNGNYIHYPHGDGKPDRHMAELYNVKNDPDEMKNLIADPKYADKIKDLNGELERLLKQTDALSDKMPLDEGIMQKLPDKKIQ